MTVLGIFLEYYSAYCETPNLKLTHMKIIFFPLLTLFLSFSMIGQVGINTTNPMASLDVQASDENNPSSEDGILIPKMNILPTSNPGADQQAMLIYLATDQTGINISGTAQDYPIGFYYWDNSSSNWIGLEKEDFNGWRIDGNDNTTRGANFIGTTGGAPANANFKEVDFRVNGDFVARLTQKGQFELESGRRTVYIGFEAGENSNGTYSNNTFTGFRSGTSNGVGSFNSAYGSLSLFDNISGIRNTAIGYRSLRFLTAGENNTALGTDALLNATDSENNTALGANAFLNLTTGSDNVGIGLNAGSGLTIGNDNVFIGNVSSTSRPDIRRAVNIGYQVNVLGNDAVVIGSESNSDAFRSIAIGNKAKATSNDAIAIGTNSGATDDEAVALGNLAKATNEFSTALGFDSQASQISSTAVGHLTRASGANSTALGFEAEAAFANSTAIGSGAIASGKDRIRLGNSSIDAIEAAKQITTPSDGRFKFDVEENVPGLSFINSLRPVTYKFDLAKLSTFRNEPNIATNTNKIETGFIAQEVEAAVKALNYDFSGVSIPDDIEKNNYALSYSQFVVPLVKAIQEQQVQIEKLQKEVLEINTLKEQIAALTALVNKKM